MPPWFAEAVGLAAPSRPSAIRATPVTESSGALLLISGDAARETAEEAWEELSPALDDLLEDPWVRIPPLEVFSFRAQIEFMGMAPPNPPPDDWEILLDWDPDEWPTP
jgi:hypothetical protein